MRFMTVAALSAGVWLLASCAAGANRAAPPGGDAGYLVLGLSAYDSVSSRAVTYDIVIRKVDGSGVESVSFTPRKVADLPFMGTKTDFHDDTEAGIVDVRKLAPGEYEIFRINAAMYGGVLQWHWHSEKVIHLPFTIAPGQTTYLGSFQGHAISKGHVISLGAPLPASAYFVVYNRKDRDIPIALRKAPYLTEIKVQIPQATDLRDRYFLDKCPGAECD